MYRSCVGFQVPASFAGAFSGDLGWEAPGWAMRPEAMPRPRGRRTEMAAFWKTVEGRVRPGMWDILGRGIAGIGRGKGVPKGSMVRCSGMPFVCVRVESVEVLNSQTRWVLTS